MMLLTEGQRSDHYGAAHLLPFLPSNTTFIADKGYDSDTLRSLLRQAKIKPCIPARKGRVKTVKHSKRDYKTRHKVENAFAKIKDW